MATPVRTYLFTAAVHRRPVRFYLNPGRLVVEGRDHIAMTVSDHAGEATICPTTGKQRLLYIVCGCVAQAWHRGCDVPDQWTDGETVTVGTGTVRARLTRRQFGERGYAYDRAARVVGVQTGTLAAVAQRAVVATEAMWEDWLARLAWAALTPRDAAPRFSAFTSNWALLSRPFGVPQDDAPPLRVPSLRPRIASPGPLPQVWRQRDGGRPRRAADPTGRPRPPTAVARVAAPPGVGRAGRA